MKRKILALALGATVILAGACAQADPEATSDESGTETEEPLSPATVAPEMELVDVPVEKPAPGAAVDASELPDEMGTFTSINGVTPEQQNCINAAIKQAIDADPSIVQSPGKANSLGGGAVAVCDAAAALTDPLVDNLAAGMAGDVKVTPEQSSCLKKAFADNPQATGKLIAGATTINIEAMREAIAAVESGCGVKISDALNMEG